MVGYVAAVMAIFFGDTWIKEQIEKSRTDDSGNVLRRETKEAPAVPQTFLGGRIFLRKYHNTGAMLDLGRKRSRAVAALSVILSAVMTAAFLCSLGQRGNRTLRTGLSLLLGGAFSNTYDRLKRKYVVDYVSFHVSWKPLRQIVFNLADFCILIGALLIVIGTPEGIG